MFKENKNGKTLNRTIVLRSAVGKNLPIIISLLVIVIDNAFQ